MSGFARDHFLVATYEHMSLNATPTLLSAGASYLASFYKKYFTVHMQAYFLACNEIMCIPSFLPVVWVSWNFLPNKMILETSCRQ